MKLFAAISTFTIIAAATHQAAAAPPIPLDAFGTRRALPEQSFTSGWVASCDESGVTARVDASPIVEVSGDKLVVRITEQEVRATVVRHDSCAACERCAHERLADGRWGRPARVSAVFDGGKVAQAAPSDGVATIAIPKDASNLLALELDVSGDPETKTIVWDAEKLSATRARSKLGFLVAAFAIAALCVFAVRRKRGAAAAALAMFVFACSDGDGAADPKAPTTPETPKTDLIVAVGTSPQSFEVAHATEDGRGTYRATISVAPLVRGVKDDRLNVHFDDVHVVKKELERRNPGGSFIGVLADVSWEGTISELDHPYQRVTKVRAIFDKGRAEATSTSGNFELTIPKEAKSLASLEVDFSWQKNEKTLKFGPSFAKGSANFVVTAKSYIDEIGSNVGTVPNGNSATLPVIAKALELREFPTSAAKDKGYRLYTSSSVSFSCDGDHLIDLQMEKVTSEIGNEGPVSPPPGIVTKETFRQTGPSEGEIGWFFQGRPHPSAEGPLFDQVKRRTSIYIWHAVSGRVSCKDGRGSWDVDIRGSAFPSHVLFVDGKGKKRISQGPLSDLWVSDDKDPTLVK